MYQGDRFSLSQIFFVAIILSPLLVACGGGGRAPAQTPPPPPPANSAPTSNAGGDQNAETGQLINLDGSGSDPEGGSLDYSWSQIIGPSVTIDNSESSSATFVTLFTGSSEAYTFELTVTDAGGLTAMDSVEIVTSSNEISCTVASPPLGFDPFYEKYCDANGIPIVSSGNVPSSAVRLVALQSRKMTSMRPDVLAEMVRNGAQISIIANEEVLTDIPEYSDFYTRFPGTDWDSLDGVGGVIGQPVGSTSEENVLCYMPNPREGMNVLFHELGHTMKSVGLERLNDGAAWLSRITAAYNTALSAGLWANTWSAIDSEEYFAEAADIWYDAGFQNDAFHNHVNTRAELLNYDPDLYQIMEEVLPEIDISLCP